MSLLTEQRPTGYGGDMNRHLGYGNLSSTDRTLSVPAEVAQELGLDVPHTVVEFVEHDGEVVMRPRVAVHPNDAWFWEEGQQQAEREAEEEIANGELSEPMTGEEFLAHLERLSEESASEGR